MTENIYHEKQRLAFCAIHTLNNILQGPIFTKEKLDEVSQGLSPNSWVNPHRSLLGIGNYDVNIIEKCLDTEGYKIQWFDSRLPIDSIDMEKAFAFIVNDTTVPENFFKRIAHTLWESNHWFGCRKFNTIYYNLDSKIPEPLPIGNEAEFIKYLQDHVKKQNHIFIVLLKTEENWRKQDQQQQNNS